MRKVAGSSLEKPLFQIEGDGFDLVPLLEHHLPLTLAWRNADDVRMWFKTPDAISPDQHRHWYASYLQKPDDFIFLVRQRDSGALTGQIAIYGIDHARSEAEIGRLIAAPGHEGTGLMKKACASLIDYATNAIGLKRIRLEVLDSNLRAIRLYERLGFRVMGHDGRLLLMTLGVTPSPESKTPRG